MGRVGKNGGEEADMQTTKVTQPLKQSMDNMFRLKKTKTHAKLAQK